MGNPNSKPDDRVRSISREVNSLRSSLRTSKRNITKSQKEHLVETLATQSSEVSSYHGKVKRKELQVVLKNISDTMQDVLKIEPVETDRETVESDVFDSVPLSQRRSNSLGSLRSKSKVAPTVTRSSVPTLRDIEAKVEEMRSSVATAIANKDANLLRVYKKTLTVIAADLELIHVEQGTPSAKRKESVDKKVIVLFQKVSKSLNVMKKDDTQQNQAKHAKKRSAMSELGEIELKLAENESLLDKMMKQQSSADFATIRNNIVENNQRLAKVDIVDNEVKQRVVLLSQKLTEAVKNLDQIMAKREFDSKFAKSIHNYERVMKNFNSKTNSKDTVDNLQSLRNSLENLEEINEATKHRKRELLTNINTSINKISELVPTEDEKIVEKIVEDNVILRKKVRSMDKEHTVIDQFIAYWNNVKTNFNVNSYSHLSLLRIDAVLEEMQESIQDIRIQIAQKCDLNMPTNLVRKRSQSVPKLSNARNSYGSTKSVDQLIKTKARMYNLPEPQIQNRRFSKIEEIKMQVHYIKEKVEEGNDNKEILKSKLEQFRNNLQDYKNDPNQAVSNNANLVSNEIIELLHQIVLGEYQNKYERLSKKVETFDGKKNDKEYDDLKYSLIDLNRSLQEFTIPIQYEHLNQEKYELESQVSQTLDALLSKASYSNITEDDYTKELRTKLQALSEKVKRFSGTYKGVLYNQLERELNKLLLDAGEKVKNKIWAEELVKEAERLLKILEQRSSVAQSFRGNKISETRTEEQQNMTKIKRDLLNIKREIDRTPDSNVEQFIGFQSRLDLVNFELSQINTRSNENLAKEKEIYVNETETLKNVVDAKVALSQQPAVHWQDTFQIEPQTYPKTDINKEMEQFESAFSTIKQKISATSYEEGAIKFAALADEISALKEKLEHYKFIRGTDLYQRQSTLLNDMQYYCDALRQEANDIKYVQNIESTSQRLQSLVEEKHDVDVMRKQLQELKKEVQHHNFTSENELLKKRQSVVQKNIDDMQSKLNELDAKQEELEGVITSIKKIEDTIKGIAREVSVFVGLKSDRNYYRLTETLSRAIIDLDSIIVEKDNLNAKKRTLLKEAQVLMTKLDERTTQTKDVTDIEEAINNLSTTPENSQTIQAKIREIESRIANLKLVNELIPRKNACKQKLNVLFNKTLLLNSTQDDHRQSGYVSQTYNFAAANPVEKIEEELSDIQTKVENATTIDDLKKLDEKVQKLELELSKLKVLKGSTGYATYQGITKKVGDIVDLIEEKMQDHDRLSSVNAEVDEISYKMNTPLTHDEINKLDERLNQLLVTLRKINNPTLKAEIDGTMLRIMLCSNKISDYLKSVESTKL